MKKCLILVLLLFNVGLFLAPVNTAALTVTGDNNVSYRLKNEKKITTETAQPNCKSLLGSTGDSKSVAWLLNKILGYIQVLGPILVIILSSIDFAKVVITSDDEAMAKAQKKLIIRLILAGALFFLPVLVKVLLATFGLTSDPTCGIG